MRTPPLAGLTAGICVSFVVLAPTGLSRVSGAQKETFVPATLLAQEQPVLDLARISLQEFDTETTRLAALNRVSSADYDRLVQQVALIKQQLPGVQRSLMAATAKLRTAGKWTSEFDSFVLDNLRRRAKTAVIETMTQAGGARALIDQVVSDVNQVGAEMDTILEELRPKNALQRLIEPVLGTPVSAQCLCLKRRAQKIYAAVYVMVCALHPSCS